MGGVNPQSTYGVGRNTGKNIIRYIASSNVWEYVGNLPEPRHQHCIQFLKGRIYLVGSKNDKIKLYTFFLFCAIDWIYLKAALIQDVRIK